MHMSNTTPPGWYPDSQNPGQQRYWDGAQWTDHTAPTTAAAPQGPPLPTQGGAYASPVESPQKKNWFLRHKILSAVLAFLIIAVIASAASSGGGSEDDTAKDSSDSTRAEDSPPNAEEPETEDESEPEPEPKWKTVSKLSGNTNNAGPDFRLNGCDTRMTYDVQGAESTIVAFYVMDSGTQLMEDGGIPVASPTESGAGETVIRKDDGDYYIEVVAANAEWQVQVQEKC